MQIQNSIAVVTGANRGVGRALVAALLEAGAAKIYATARTQEGLDALDAIDARVKPVSLEVTDASQIATLATKAGDATLLFNNAAVIGFGGALDAEAAAISRNLEVNLFGPLNVTRAMAPVIQGNGGGAVVNILTLLSLASMPGITPYNISKAAAWSMTLSQRAELAPKNISVHSVFPGAIDTDMVADFDMDKASPADVANAIITGVNAGEEDIFPDTMAQQVYGAWRQDHKGVEKQFAAM
jgi:NAD(P)-dependent dehydrogenase (short-subunit alcohol dehydrogenase family)